MTTQIIRTGNKIVQCNNYRSHMTFKTLNPQTMVPETILTVKNPDKLRPEQIFRSISGHVGIANPLTMTISIN